MKVLKTIAATAALVFAVNANAAESTNDVKFVGDLEFSGFCKAVVMNDVRVLRSNVSRNVGRIAGSQREVLRIVTAEDGLTCNGISLIQFAEKREANKVREFLASHS